MSVRKIPAVEIRICDRCKADETAKLNPFSFASMQLRCTHTQGDHGASYTVDLCRNCTQAFDTWMKLSQS